MPLTEHIVIIIVYLKYCAEIIMYKIFI